ncbi:MAG: hypothetical protein ACQETQ_02200 [Spirochaetota bacterium]
MIRRISRNRHFIIALVVVLTAALTLSGCATVTEATKAEPGVLAFAVEQRDEASKACFGALTITVESTEDPQVREHVVANAGDQFVVADGLPAGDYRIADMQFRLAGSELSEKLEAPEQTVNMEAEPISVYPETVVFGEDKSGECINMRPLSEAEIRELEQQVADNLELAAE